MATYICINTFQNTGKFENAGVSLIASGPWSRCRRWAGTTATLGRWPTCRPSFRTAATCRPPPSLRPCYKTILIRPETPEKWAIVFVLGKLFCTGSILETKGSFPRPILRYKFAYASGWKLESEKDKPGDYKNALHNWTCKCTLRLEPNQGLSWLEILAKDKFFSAKRNIINALLLPTKGRLVPLHLNIRQGWKCFTRTNALAYLSVASVTEKKNVFRHWHLAIAVLTWKWLKTSRWDINTDSQWQQYSKTSFLV